MQTTAQLQALIASAEQELREARKSTDDGLYAILCALGVMKLKNEINRSRYPEWRKSA